MTEVSLEKLRERALEVEPPGDPLQRLVAVVIIVVTLLAALAAYLETRADSSEARAAREAQSRSVNAGTALLESAARRARRRMVSGISDELFSVGAVLERLGQQVGLAPAYSAALGRARLHAAGRTDRLERLLFGADRASFDAAQARPALREGEFQKAYAEERDVWSDRRARLIAVITVLAVALFLLGLTLTWPGTRGLPFFVVGCLLALAATGWGVSVVASSPSRLPRDARCGAHTNRLEQAICGYVDGRILLDFAETNGPEAERRLIRQAISRFDGAIELAPKYEEAYRTRGSAWTAADFLAPGGPYGSPKAQADFEKAVELDPRDAAAWGSLADAQFWRRDYAAALRSIERAISLHPQDARANLDRALYLLANGKEREYGEQLVRVAVVHGRIPGWLRDAVNRDFARDLGIAAETRAELRPAVARLRRALARTITEIDASIRTFGSGRPFPEPRGKARIQSVDWRISADERSLVIRLGYADIAPDRLLLYDVFVNGERVKTVGPQRWQGRPGRPKYLQVAYHPRVYRPGDTVDVDVFVDGNLLRRISLVLPGPRSE